MGKRDQMGRYPYHLHNLGSYGINSYARNLSIHHTYQRCFVVHCTDHARVLDNVCFDIPGFSYMLVSSALRR